MQAGVGHVIYTSVVSPEPGNPAAVVETHRQTEADLRAAGCAWTLLRNELYSEFQEPELREAAASGRLVHNRGDGRAAYVSRLDCAAAAAAVLAGDGHEGRTYDVTGPESLSAAGSRGHLRGPRRPAGRAGGRRRRRARRRHGRGLRRRPPRPSARAFVASFGRAIREGWFAEVSDAVETLTGPAAPERPRGARGLGNDGRGCRRRGDRVGAGLDRGGRRGLGTGRLAAGSGAGVVAAGGSAGVVGSTGAVGSAGVVSTGAAGVVAAGSAATGGVSGGAGTAGAAGVATGGVAGATSAGPGMPPAPGGGGVGWPGSVTESAPCWVGASATVVPSAGAWAPPAGVAASGASPSAVFSPSFLSPAAPAFGSSAGWREEATTTGSGAGVTTFGGAGRRRARRGGGGDVGAVSALA